MTITLTREEAQKVEQYLKPYAIVPVDMQTTRLLVNALRAQLTQPQPEPVAWADKHDIERENHDFWVSRQQPAKDGIALYRSPQRK